MNRFVIGITFALGAATALLMTIRSPAPSHNPPPLSSPAMLTVSGSAPSRPSNAIPISAMQATPLVINAAGFYYLTGNVVQVNNGENGIEISANDVVLDLSGYAVLGQGSAAGGSGIVTTANVTKRCGIRRSRPQLGRDWNPLQ